MLGVELTAHVCDGHVVVALRGEMDVTGVADAEAAITVLVVPGRCLVVDISVLDFIDCAALGAVLGVQELAWSTGGDLVLAAPQPHVERLLILTGKDEVFWVLASMQAAVAGLPVGRARYAGRRRAVSTAHPGRAAPSRTGAG
jgi:anti-sigma B factor antagonist